MEKCSRLVFLFFVICLFDIFGEIIVYEIFFRGELLGSNKVCNNSEGLI